MSVELSSRIVCRVVSRTVNSAIRLVNSSLSPFIKVHYKVAKKNRYILKITLVMASSRDIEVEEYEEIVGHADSSVVPRRSFSAESVNDVSTFQKPMMEVEEFAPTARPILRYTEHELAEQTQVSRKVRVVILSPETESVC